MAASQASPVDSRRLSRRPALEKGAWIDRPRWPNCDTAKRSVKPGAASIPYSAPCRPTARRKFVVSVPAPTSPIAPVRFPRSARCHGAAAWPDSPRAAPVCAFRNAANPWRSPGRLGSAVPARPCGSRCLANAGFRLAPWCPGAAAWRPLRDALDGYGRSAVEARAAERWVLAPRRVAWPYPARAHRLTSRGRAGCMWTRRKRLGLACSTFNIDRLTADRLPNRSTLPSVAVSADNGAARMFLYSSPCGAAATRSRAPG